MIGQIVHCDQCVLDELHTELTPNLTVTTTRHAEDCPALATLEATA